MERKVFYRNGQLVRAVEVTGNELLELANKYDFISVSKKDKEVIESLEDKDQVVGIITSTLEDFPKVLKKLGMLPEPNIIPDDTPDCWFVLNPKKHNYKSLKDDYFTFGEAVELLKIGIIVARVCWNGKGMWLVYVPGREVEIAPHTPYWRAGLRGKVKIDGHIDMYTAQGTVQPGWLASQADIQAEDWVVVKVPETKLN